MASHMKETPISSWKDLSGYLERFLVEEAVFWNKAIAGKPPEEPPPCWLFRGVTNTRYDLIPKIGRKSASFLPYKLRNERSLLEGFKTEARPYVQFEPKNDLQWLAVAQHNGLPTRLLDWTESPLIATFFAVKNGGTIQVIDPNTMEQKNVQVRAAVYATKGIPFCDDSMVDPLRIPEVLAYVPPHISPQVPAQRSVFTIHPTPDKEPEYPDLEKLVIAPNACMQIKMLLAKQGVNTASLFPSIGGLCEQLAWDYKWNLLRKYRQRN